MRDTILIIIIVVNLIFAAINAYHIYAGVGSELKYINVILLPAIAIFAALILWEVI